MKDAAKLLLTTLDEEQATEIALTATATKVVNQTAEKRPDANTSPALSFYRAGQRLRSQASRRDRDSGKASRLKPGVQSVVSNS